MKEKRTTKIDNKPKENLSKKEIKKQNQLLAKILIITALIFLVAIAGYFILNNMKNFSYEGMKFNVLKQGSITFYHTSFPLYQDGEHVADYNVYIRNNPKKLDNIVFDGDLYLEEMMIVNYTNEINCEGRGIISVANMVQIFDALGITVAQDSDATCDEEGRYMFVNIFMENETRIEQTGPACYNIYIKDCEILEGTERFILEALKQTV